MQTCGAVSVETLPGTTALMHAKAPRIKGTAHTHGEGARTFLITGLSNAAALECHNYR